MNDTWVFEVMPFGDDLGIIRAGNSLIAQMIGSPDDSTREREGRLMAAAPELLEAAKEAVAKLEAICRFCDERVDKRTDVPCGKEQCHTRRLVKQLKGAIAKAEGRADG